MAPTQESAALGTKPNAELLADRDAKSQELLEAMPDDVSREAETLLMDTALIDRVVADIERVGVVGETELGLTVYLVGTSRVLDRPLAGLVQGTSSSGKSFVIETTAGLMPDEWILRATDITPNALYYLDPGRLMHTLVVAGERSRQQADEAAEAKRALREMLASGELRKVVTIKVGDRMMAVELYQPGPIAYVESTTHTTIFDEDANRYILLSTDESAEQTARVVRAAARVAVNGAPDSRQVRQLHHALQRMLRRVKIKIPYAEQLADAIPTHRPEARRAFSAALTLVRAVTTLHQRQRRIGLVEHGETIDATIDDYVIARRLMAGPLGRSLGGALPGAVTRFAQRVAQKFGSETFSSAMARDADPIVSNKGKVNQYLRSLVEAGVVECTEPGKGPKPAWWKVVGPIPQGGVAWLPAVDSTGRLVP